jgi:outer membrane receptor protein involved in Fe transport
MRCKVFSKKASVAVSIFTLFIILLLANQACAQVSGATLTGTVRDPSGGFIPNAPVSIKDLATDVVRKVTTDSAGLFTAPNLLPGDYAVTITAPGFSTEVRTGITLTVGAQQVVDVTMRVGQVTQTVEVTGEAPTVQLTSSTLGATVDATTVRELPLNGRSWTDLTNLQPGVVTAESHVGDNNRGYGAQVSISGARPQQNNYRLDGISINDYANGGPGSLLGGNLGVDAIEEFSVLTSNYSAEYGKSSGGVVNAITRSGTNQLHGSAYEFLRNSALDARNFFDGATVPPFKRNQFGASAGGPIRKDRIFIFGDYESIRQSLAVTHLWTVLSPAARAGNLAGQAHFTPDPMVLKYIGLDPLPNEGLVGDGNQGLYRVVGQQVVNENYFTIRVDQRLSEKDSLFETYSFDNSPSVHPDDLGNVLLHDVAKRQFVALEESHIFSPRVVNTVRFGFVRDRVVTDSGTAINPLAGDPTQGWTTGVPGATAVFVSGIYTIGPGVHPPSNRSWNAFQVYDDAFVTKGLHSLKFGAGFERDQLNEIDITADYSGIFTFGTLASFLTNNPSRFSGASPKTVSPRGMRQSIVGAYIQDDWRWRPNLTLNLGLRYEMSTVPTEVQGKLTNLPTVSAATPHLGDPYFLNPTLRNFEPRVGFSWDPFHNGKTAVRAGFGMFDVLPMLYTTVTMVGRGAPFYQIGATSKLPQGSFPGGAGGSLSPKSLEYEYVQHNPPRNYVMQWNLNVQRELLRDLTLVVGYAGSRGVHQGLRVDDANMVFPRLTSAGYLWPAPIGSGTSVNPNGGAVRALTWPGNSFYDAFELGILKRMSHGLQIQGSFTWGKSIDNSSGVTNGDSFANAFSSPHYFDLRTSRAVSDYDIPRILVLNGSWNLPTSKSDSPAVAFVANGWELGAIFKLNDGVPFTATFGSDGDPLGLNSSDPWDFPNRLRGPGCATLTNPGSTTNYVKTQCFALPTAPSMAFWQANCDTTSPIFGPSKTTEPFPICFNLGGSAGRNILRGPGLTNLDFSLFKNNYVKRISENFNAQFRLEVFNILNHANFNPPAVGKLDIFDSTGVPTGTAGLLTSTTTTSRQIQFALKFAW